MSIIHDVTSAQCPESWCRQGCCNNFKCRSVGPTTRVSGIRGTCRFMVGDLKWRNQWASMVAFYVLVGRWKNVSAASDIPCMAGVIKPMTSVWTTLFRPIISDAPQTCKRRIACPPGLKSHCCSMIAHIFCFDLIFVRTNKVKPFSGTRNRYT